jgi:hypothetical protein
MSSVSLWVPIAELTLLTQVLPMSVMSLGSVHRLISYNVSVQKGWSELKTGPRNEYRFLDGEPSLLYRQYNARKPTFENRNKTEKLT